MQYAPAMQRLQSAHNRPGHGQPVLRGQRPMAKDVLEQALALEVLQDEVGASFEAMRQRDVIYLDQRRVIEVLDRALLLDDGSNRSVETVNAQTLDNDLALSRPVIAQE